MDEFVVSMPLFLLNSPNPEPLEGEDEEDVLFQSALTESGLPFMPVFTEELFAERWMKQVGVVGKALYPVTTLRDFETMLEMFKAYGPWHVGFDPDMTYAKYLVLPVEKVLEYVRRQAAEAEEDG